MANRLRVTELDFDTIKTNLKTYLQQQTEFTDYDFEGSGLSVLLDILAYNTHYNAYYLNMVANESFLDTAVLRDSVVSHAKTLGYTPRSMSAPRATIQFVVDTSSNTSGTLTLPKGYRFLSNQVDGVVYSFVTLEDTSVEKSNTTYTFDDLNIYEGELVNYQYIQNNSSNPKQLFVLPDSNIDTLTLKVTVNPSTSNTSITTYTLATDVLSVTANSEVYFLQEGRDGQYQVYFGDGVIGKKLGDGNVVNFEYLTTNGTVANKANNFIGTSSVSGFTNFYVVPLSAAGGGTVRETVDEIKFSAPLNLISQNRAVTKNDYIRLIQQKYPAFEAVNVWGGEEQDPPVYGKVFISAKPKNGFEVTDTEKEYVKEKILKPISILTVNPEIVDVDYNYLKVESSVFYDPTKTTLTDADLKTNIRTIIQNYADTNLNQFNSYFKYSGLESTIDSYSTAIVSNEIELFVGKKFRPDLLNPDSYILDYGMELKKGTTEDNFKSMPTFFMDDEEGVNRECFFEEIPSSYSGIQSITVTNPGYNYTTTPTVTIVGDGNGATAYATIVNGKIDSITVTNPGIGYTSAAIQITGGSGLLGAASAVLEGRYGQIRIAYYKLDETSSTNTKVIMNTNKNSGIAGVIDYVLGKITISNFNPTDVNNDFKDIMIQLRPKINVIQSKLNKMLVLDSDDPTSITVKTTKTS